ncbi:Uncharacterised protein [Mycobacteroides abscessus subsp. massiliense]|uniref:hypothetical protein n=1 Tax=Mycobacteroides abscessus TaxID=36809 RepID=UPI0009A6EDC7|nr:hypothetical protein [Mycobacteroides abscessus]SKU75376.1 Uncharacterised protein [Mycobacteroides abscessus subsp. massiliense]SKV06781.1 Uncharacterised protein [Mycobacteroides abscessus subsp. massiliense]
MTEQAVIIEWDIEPPLDFIFEAEDQLSQAISSGELGEVDGNEVGNGTATIYLYGPSCESIWKAIEPIARQLSPRPARALIRPGGPEAEPRRVSFS